jgi:hypothetical protein
MSRVDFIRGNTPRVYIELRNSEKALVDPATLSFKFRADGIEETTYSYGTDSELVRDSLGIYYALLYLDTNEMKNRYMCRWTGTDSNGNNFAEEIVLDTHSFYQERS